MDPNDRRAWMFADAVDMLMRAERLHRQMFEPQRPAGAVASWEPPVDIIEMDHEVLILAALPGVDPEQINATLEHGILVITGHRKLPPEFQTAVIHRLELPQGRFERRVQLPNVRYTGHVRQGMLNGCLVIGLVKA